VTQPRALDAAFAEAAQRRGRVDVAIANAGVWPPEELTLGELDEERVRAVLDVNLFGAIWTARAFLRTLARSGPRADGRGACLLFTGSTAGRFGELGHADYAVSKAGLEGLVRTLKNEIVRLDPYGRVNMVEPGWTVTSMARPALQNDANIQRVLATLPLQQLARAQDIARTLLYLASPTLARHVTGQTLTVAGGMEGRLLREPAAVDVDAARARLLEE
jgi:3-oxoacyl-[acyl-carrier protein] reductase